MESREHKPAPVCSPRWMNLGLCVAVLICGYVTSADSNEILSIATFRDIAEAEIPSPRGWAASKSPLISIDVLGRQEIPLDTFMCEKLIWCKGKFSWRFRESSVSIIVNVTALGGSLPFRLNLFFIDGQEETTCLPDCENDKVFLESDTDGSGSIELDREDYLCLGNQSVEVYSFNVDENKLTSIEIQTAFDNRLLFPINFDPIVSFPTRMFIFPTEDTAGLECPVGKWCLNHTCWQWSEQNSTLLYVVEINLITFKHFTNCTVVFLNEINQFYDIFLLASGNPKYNFITKGRIDIATFDDEVRIQIPLDTIYDLQAAKQIKILPVFLPFIQKPKIEPLYWTQEDLEQKPTYLFHGSFGAQDSKSVYAMSAVERNAHYDGGLYYVTLKKLGVHPADDEERLLCVDPVNGVGTCNIGLSRSVLKIPPVPDVYIFKDGETIGFKCEMNRKCMYEGSWDFVNLYNERTTALEFKFPTGGRVLNYNVYLLDPKDPSKKWIYKLIILNNALRAQDLVISEAVFEEEDMATFSFNISWTTDLYNYAYFVRANDSTGSGCHIGRWCRNLTFWEAKKAHDRLSIVIKLKNPRNELLSNLSIFLLDHNRLQFRIYSLSTMNGEYWCVTNTRNKR
ncbi:hypothetical protein PoB_002938200 [Plakobranchus ocellatus]|uniref:EF-hand domain-containing protein n=1 Tax=Plakobranchus ocellatus TaxID=259542 RepID=A0AAV4A7P6_9GAST|nr:hypothetical protein PoB_002938200 [Plakobranchus ocellatus]